MEKKKKQVVPGEGDVNKWLFDTHCHLHDDTYNVHKIPHLQMGGMCLMGTWQRDWKVVHELHQTKPNKIHAAFGLHPWYAHRKSEAWLDELAAFLADNPEAIVGEIGLDKASKTPGRCEYDAQKAAFYEQLVLAGVMQRPVSVHCVRAYGDMLETFKRLLDEKGMDGCPPAIAMHSYGGSIDMMRCFTKLKGIGGRFYFGFSKCINMRSPKTCQVIQQIPEDRLLLESDQNTPTVAVKAMLSMCSTVATSREWSVAQTAETTHANAVRFFSFHHTETKG